MVAPRIAREQWVALGLGVGANKEVGQHAGFGATALAVSSERMGGLLRCWLGHIESLDAQFFKK